MIIIIENPYASGMILVMTSIQNDNSEDYQSVKNKQLFALAQKRKQMRYDGYNAIGDYHGGIYECNYVSPYTKSAGNINAKVMIVLQDWCSEDFFKKDVCSETLKYGYTPSIQTNINLKRLLKEHFELDFKDIYATNLFPYIKFGAMNAPIKPSDLRRAALDFTLPLIDIIRPNLVVCLGKSVFDAIRSVCGEGSVKNMEQAIQSHFPWKGAEIWCQAHAGRLGKNNRNKGNIDRVSVDWKCMHDHVHLFK
jgi:hypothetical protein